MAACSRRIIFTKAGSIIFIGTQNSSRNVSAIFYPRELSIVSFNFVRINHFFQICKDLIGLKKRTDPDGIRYPSQKGRMADHDEQTYW
jgi:hypothetical protein